MARERSRSPADGLLVRVTTISGDLVLEQSFSGSEVLGRVRDLLREKEPSAQLRLFLGTSEPPEDRRLQELEAGGVVSLQLVRLSTSLALTGHCNGCLQLWDLDGRCIHLLRSGESQVIGLEVDWATKRALSGDLCHVVRYWDLQAGRLLHVFEGHRDVLRGVAVDWDRDQAVTHDAAGRICCWDLEKGEAVHRLDAHEGGVEDVEVDWEKQRFVSVGSDFIKMWLQGEVLWTWPLRGAELLGLEADWQTDRLAACWSTAIYLWHLQGQLLWVLRHPEIRGFQVSWDEQRCLSYGEGDELLLWDIEHGKQVQRMACAQAVTGAICTWQPFRCVSYGESLRLWEDAHGFLLDGHRDLVCGVEVSWHMERALSWSDDSTLRLWDLQARRCLRVFEGHVGPVWSVHVNWQGRALSYSFAQRSVMLWGFDGTKQEIFLEEEASRNLSTPSWIGGAEVDWDSQRAVAWTLQDHVLRAIDLRKAQRPIFLHGCDLVSCAKLQSSEH